MSYIKKARVRPAKSEIIRNAKNALRFARGAPRIVNKQINAVVRRTVNLLEDKRILEPKTAAQMRVAIEVQAAKDGNQSWREPKSKKHYLQDGTVVPADLQDKHLTRLAKIELKRKIDENPEILEVSSFGKKPKNRLYRIFPGLESVVRQLKEDALPTASREAKIASRQGYEAALEKQKKELTLDLQNGDRNPWIGKYGSQRENAKKIIYGAAIWQASSLWNSSQIGEKVNQKKEEMSNLARDVKEKAQNKLNDAIQFADNTSRRAQQKINEFKSQAKQNARRILDAPQKSKRDTLLSAQRVPQKSYEVISSNPKKWRGTTMNKSMKSVSVPYTRTLTDDSVPSPKKYVNKMMGGKTGRMGKELTGADGVKGRYFQKGRNMSKIYEVDKPHAPQMRAMGMGGSMGMGKLQKARLVTRMGVSPRLVTRMIPFDPTTSRALRSTFPDKTTSGKIRTTINAKPSYSDAEISGILRTTVVPKIESKSSTSPNRFTIASKPPKGYMNSYTQRQLGNLKERNASIAGGYKDFRSYNDWKSQNQTPQMLNRILLNSIKDKNIVGSGNLFPDVIDFTGVKRIVTRPKPNRSKLNRTGGIGLDRSLNQEIARIRRSELAQSRRNNPVAKRATYKMHEITDENYYGNQKPRRKDTFQKNQGAFINGRKLKY